VLKGRAVDIPNVGSNDIAMVRISMGKDVLDQIIPILIAGN